MPGVSSDEAAGHRLCAGFGHPQAEWVIYYWLAKSLRILNIFTSGGPVSEACGQCGAAAVDLCRVVDSLTRPDILGADLEEQTRACRLDLQYLGVKGSQVHILPSRRRPNWVPEITRHPL